jgi:hypothetical protein
MLAEMLAWRPPSGGSRSVGVSLQPAIPQRVAPQQSPLPLHQSSTIVAQSQCGIWLRSSVALIVSAPNGVSSLLCAQGDISILRRHRLCPPNRDVTVSAIYRCRGIGRRGAEPGVAQRIGLAPIGRSA